MFIFRFTVPDCNRTEQQWHNLQHEEEKQTFLFFYFLLSFHVSCSCFYSHNFNIQKIWHIIFHKKLNNKIQWDSKFKQIHSEYVPVRSEQNPTKSSSTVFNTGRLKMKKKWKMKKKKWKKEKKKQPLKWQLKQVTVSWNWCNYEHIKISEHYNHAELTALT